MSDTEDNSPPPSLMRSDTSPIIQKKAARVSMPLSATSTPASDHEDGPDDDEDGPEVDDSEILADLPDDTDDIDLVHSRLKSISTLGLQRFGPTLKRLCLRQNNIKDLDPEVMKALENLSELDMYDNKIKDLGDALNSLVNVTTLDLSFNLLRAIPAGLRHLKKLKTVYFVQDRISTISGLESLGATLTSLELGGNKIRQIEGLDALVNLEELWLGKNKITRLENLGNLKRLRLLSMQSNRVARLENLEELESLEEIYLSHNGIPKIEGFEKNTKLRVVDIGNNQIPRIENISHLHNLEEFWANDNEIPDLSDLESQLSKLENLETVYLEGNPCQKAESASYRRKVMLALPQVKQIDATLTNTKEVA